MAERFPDPRTDKAKAHKSEAPTMSNSNRLGRVLRLFKGNRVNTTSGHPPRIDEDDVYIVPRMQPGADIYPSALDFAEFIAGLHRSSDRYPTPELVPSFLKSSPDISPQNVALYPASDAVCLSRSCDAETFLHVDQEQVGNKSPEQSREGVARATTDLQNFLWERYPAGEEPETAPVAEHSNAYAPPEQSTGNDTAQQRGESNGDFYWRNLKPLPPPPPDDSDSEDDDMEAIAIE